MQAAVPVRGVLSCGSCRQRKLKCDRNEPCGNCVTREVDCVYAPLPRGRNFTHRRYDGSQQQLDARIRNLEQLVRKMQASQIAEKQTGVQATTHKNTIAICNDGSGSSHVQDVSSLPHGEQLDIEPGRIISSDNETTYISSVHWTAIYNELEKISEHLSQDSSTGPEMAEPAIPINGPMLLEGVRYIPCIEDILSDLPPRKIVDTLISRFFSSTEPSIVILHGPTFENEYTRFWQAPQNVTIPWLGLLFGILSRGIFLYMRAQDDLPDGITDPKAAMDLFHRRSSECLVVSKYSSMPGPYTMEALLTNIQNEFARHRDAHLGVWVLAGVAVRLAMRMGYHRDSDDYSQFSVFQGEMRRRIWAIVSQLDVLTSYQLGLPSMIQEYHCDAKLPHNLLDEDFGPDSLQLPSSRPNTELTPVLYTIIKARLSETLRSVLNQVSLRRIQTYEEIKSLDQRLEIAHETVPPRFRLTSPENSVTLPTYLLIRRYNLELLYQKTRCILHRHHMTKSYREPDYNFSRSSCVEAAMSILTHQASILKEVQAGGRLYRDRWFLSSLEQHDFLLASMIVCLELTSRLHEQHEEPCPVKRDDQKGFLKFTKRDFIESLRGSLAYWDALRAKSKEAEQAFDILSAMLQKVAKASETHMYQQCGSTENGQSVEAMNLITELNTGRLQGPVEIRLPIRSNNLENIADSDNVQSLLDLSQAEQTFIPELDEIDTFFNTPDIVDWNQWEAFIQNTRTLEDN